MTLASPDSAVLSAVRWVEGVLTGALASSLAVLAIAGVGFGLLTGRIDLRRAGQVVLEVSILFGAPTVVRELSASLRGDGQAAPYIAAGLTASPAPTLKAERRDPYAGASIQE